MQITRFEKLYKKCKIWKITLWHSGGCTRSEFYSLSSSLPLWQLLPKATAINNNVFGPNLALKKSCLKLLLAVFKETHFADLPHFPRVRMSEISTQAWISRQRIKYDRIMGFSLSPSLARCPTFPFVSECLWYVWSFTEFNCCEEIPGNSENNIQLVVLLLMLLDFLVNPWKVSVVSTSR